MKLGFAAGVVIPYPAIAKETPTEKDLFETYISDPQLISADMTRRPAHYTEEHRRVLEAVRAGTATKEDRTELLLQYVAADKPARPAPEKPKPDNDQEKNSYDETSFEEQNHDDEIIIF